MPIKTYEGRPTAQPEHRFAVVAARFNELVTARLLEGCVGTLRRFGVAEDHITVVRVPGSYELPVTVQVLAESGRYAAIVALGAVVRGATDHYDYVAGEAAGGLASVARATRVPCIFGVLTCDTLEQALDRAGGKAGNKGADAAMAAIEMADLLGQLRG